MTESKSLKIVIIQGAFLPVPPKLGGAVEKMWFSLGKEFVRMGHQVTHISKKFGSMPDKEIIDGVKHIRVKGFDTPRSGILLKIMDLIYTLKTRKLLQGDHDIVISNTFWSPLVLPKKTIKSIVVDIQRMPKGQMNLYKNVLCMRANSNSVVSAIKDELDIKLHRKISMVPNPLPFVPAEDVDMSEKEQIILYTGRIHPEKGLGLLINAYKKVSHKYKLQIIGPWEISMGGGGQDYLDLLKKLADGHSVEFIPPVFDIETLNRYYSKSSIFVYPSLAEKGETFGLAPLEAMSWGSVPIVSDLLCFKDFITSGENGLVFDHSASDAADQIVHHINSLEHDAGYFNKLAVNAIGVRNTHSIPSIANLFILEFKRLLQGKHE